MVVSKTQAAALEKMTRTQQKSHSWYLLQAGRINTSKIHAVVTTSVSKPAISTVNAVCYPHKAKLERLTEDLQWGVMHNEEARQQFPWMAVPNHNNLPLKKCDFVINPSFPEVGASHNGLMHCSCCRKGCLEVRCPSKHRHNTVLQACEDTNFCLPLRGT